MILPLPPSVNSMWRSFKGRTILSKQGRAYKKACAAILAGQTPTARPVRVQLSVYMARRGCDLDNRIKPTLDVLNGTVFVDDSQVHELVVSRYLDHRRPRVEVEVVEMPEENSCPCPKCA